MGPSLVWWFRVGVVPVGGGGGVVVVVVRGGGVGGGLARRRSLLHDWLRGRSAGARAHTSFWRRESETRPSRDPDTLPRAVGGGASDACGLGE